MKMSKFIEDFLGIRLYKYQKDLLDNMNSLCNKCPSETRSVCKAYGGYCDKWKRLKDRCGIVNYILHK